MGDLLRIEGTDAPQLYARTNAYIFLGLTIFVTLRMLIPYLKRKPQLPTFDLRNWGSAIAMSVASGINVLLVGLGLGFVTDLLVNKLFRYYEKTPGGNNRWMMVTKK